MRFTKSSLKQIAASEGERLKQENIRLRAAQDQIRGFVKVMDENNWRDLKLHIERQCAVEQPAER